jgi:hypothetical protein
MLQSISQDYPTSVSQGARTVPRTLEGSLQLSQTHLEKGVMKCKIPDLTKMGPYNIMIIGVSRPEKSEVEFRFWNTI